MKFMNQFKLIDLESVAPELLQVEGEVFGILKIHTADEILCHRFRRFCGGGVLFYTGGQKNLKILKYTFNV